jgi:hypothetical protein
MEQRGLSTEMTLELLCLEYRERPVTRLFQESLGGNRRGSEKWVESSIFSQWS